MRRALQVLLSEVIDYAGLFPPAKLNMQDSVANYLRYKQGPEKWLVSRFACSAAKLPELARELIEHPEEPFVPVTVIGTASTDRRTWEHALTHDSETMNQFLEAVEDHADIEAFEIRVPDHAHLESWIADLHGFGEADVFVELPWDAAMDDSLSLLAETQWLRAKARTGGLEAAAFPSCEQVAGFIQQCANLDVPIKLTAGLHHPMPRLDGATGGRMHGFLNILTAMAIHQSQELTRAEIVSILEEEDPSAFKFSDNGLTYKEMQASTDDAEAVREVFVSYGSCSVEEPLEDLAAMGLLGTTASR